jgi:predicted acetyltransferase
MELCRRSRQQDRRVLNYRFASIDESALLAELNWQLIREEGHRNPMTVAELEVRMKGWLEREYQAVLFQLAGQDVAYALYRDTDAEIYLRQFFVVRGKRRQGIGRHAVEVLRSRLWPAGKRLTVDVLVDNQPAVAFWRSVGYRDYCLTLEIPPAEHRSA